MSSIYYLDGDQLQKLRDMVNRLHSGSDAMRDEGHKLWLLVNYVSDFQEVVDPDQPKGAVK